VRTGWPNVWVYRRSSFETFIMRSATGADWSIYARTGASVGPWERTQTMPLTWIMPLWGPGAICCDDSGDVFVMAYQHDRDANNGQIGYLRVPAGSTPGGYTFFNSLYTARRDTDRCGFGSIFAYDGHIFCTHWRDLSTDTNYPYLYYSHDDGASWDYMSIPYAGSGSGNTFTGSRSLARLGNTLFFHSGFRHHKSTNWMQGGAPTWVVHCDGSLTGATSHSDPLGVEQFIVAGGTLRNAGDTMPYGTVLQNRRARSVFSITKGETGVTAWDVGGYLPDSRKGRSFWW
jgi:hypothetical protein